MLSGNALLPHHTRRQVVAHSTFPGRGPRRNAASFQQGVRLAQSRRSGVRAPPPRYSAQAPPGAVATATGRFPPEPRPQERGCARRGRCGRAGAARRATAVGARRARGRAGRRGGARARGDARDAHSCPRGRVESWQSWLRGKRGPGCAACGVPLQTRGSHCICDRGMTAEDA